MRDRTVWLLGAGPWLWRSQAARLLVGLGLGVLFGWALPAHTDWLAFLTTGFLSLLKLLAYPLILLSVLHGVRAIGPAAQLRRFGCWALLCSETLSLASLACGAGAAWLLGTGTRLQGMLGPTAATGFSLRLPAFTLHPFLITLLLAIVAGLVLRARPLPRWDPLLERSRASLLRALRGLVLLAPLPAFASAAGLTAAYGHRIWLGLADVLAGLYLASGAYIVLVLGALCLACGTSLARVIGQLKEELMLVVSTSASVSAMTGVAAWLEGQGCRPRAVRLLVPLNFSFGLNGSVIYLGFCLVVLVQASGLTLSAGDYLGLLALAALTSKGACGVAGSAYVVLGLTLSAIPGIPPDGFMLLFGIERLMKCRLLTNLLGVAVGCLAVCSWSGQRVVAGTAGAREDAGLASSPVATASLRIR